MKIFENLMPKLVVLMYLVFSTYHTVITVMETANYTLLFPLIFNYIIIISLYRFIVRRLSHNNKSDKGKEYQEKSKLPNIIRKIYGPVDNTLPSKGFYVFGMLFHFVYVAGLISMLFKELTTGPVIILSVFIKYNILAIAFNIIPVLLVRRINQLFFL